MTGHSRRGRIASIVPRFAKEVKAGARFRAVGQSLVPT
jgi:hypothetical protein